MAVWTCINRAEAPLTPVEEKLDLLNYALGLFEELARTTSIRRDPEAFADIQFSIGYASSELAEYRDPAENCRRAEEAYNRAL